MWILHVGAANTSQGHCGCCQHFPGTLWVLPTLPRDTVGAANTSQGHCGCCQQFPGTLWVLPTLPRDTGCCQHFPGTLWVLPTLPRDTVGCCQHFPGTLWVLPTLPRDTQSPSFSNTAYSHLIFSTKHTGITVNKMASVSPLHQTGDDERILETELSCMILRIRLLKNLCIYPKYKLM
jgi:hypothetical protein